MNTAKAVAVGFLLVAAIALAGERRPFENDKPGAVVNLAQARLLAAEREQGGGPDTIGPIGVAGFNFARELDFGGGLRAFVISCNLGGGLILFGANGNQIAVFRAWEINSFQVFDFDGDGVFELITEQRDGVGTGIAFWHYHVYGLSRKGIRELWEAESWYFDGNSEATPIVRQGFIRCVPSDIQYPAAHVIYIANDVRRKRRIQKAFALKGSRFVEVALQPAF